MYLENDINTDIYKEIKSEYNLLIKEITKYYYKDIYLIGYYSNSKINDKNINKLNKILIINNNVTYINTSFISKNSQKYLLNSNNMYPNNLGYKEISSKLILKVSKKLEK